MLARLLLFYDYQIVCTSAIRLIFARKNDCERKVFVGESLYTCALSFRKAFKVKKSARKGHRTTRHIPVVGKPAFYTRFRCGKVNSDLFCARVFCGVGAAVRNKPRCSSVRTPGKRFRQTKRILSASARSLILPIAFLSAASSACIQRRRAFCSHIANILSIVAASLPSAKTVESISRFISSWMLTLACKISCLLTASSIFRL